jgi:UDP-N-acetylmuramate: L-alanyl-gamma-D-glutamyl-meso-diaminopimelate ligase
VANNTEALVSQLNAGANSGGHIICMSNGGFGGIHQKILDALPP